MLDNREIGDVDKLITYAATKPWGGESAGEIAYRLRLGGQYKAVLVEFPVYSETGAMLPAIASVVARIKDPTDAAVVESAPKVSDLPRPMTFETHRR